MRYLPLLFIFILTGCCMTTGTKNISYNIELSNIKQTKKDNSSKMGLLSFEDSSVKFNFSFPDFEGIHYTLENKSSEITKVNWDEVTLNFETINSACTHYGVPFQERYNLQAYSIILPNTTIRDCAIPKSEVHFTSGQYGGWKVTPFLNTIGWTPKSQLEAINMKGKYITLYIPLIIKNISQSYTFKFVISDVITQID